MVVRYRNAGAWGAGEGMRLTSLQVDENFHTLDQSVQSIIDNPIPGVGIANIALAGTRTLRITLDDNSTYDFVIPVAAPHWRDEWAAETEYFALDRFWVEGVGLFLVLQDHVSDTVFDAAATIEDSDGIHDLYYKEFGLAGLGAPVANLTGSGHTLSLGLLNTFFVCTNPLGCTVTIPDNASVEIPIGTEYHFWPAGAEPVEVVEGGTDVFIYPVPGFLFQTEGIGRPITVKKVAEDDWVIFGGLAPEESA